MKRTENSDKRNWVSELEMEEYNEIVPYLDEYAVNFPSELEIEKTIKALNVHMPAQKRTHLKHLKEKSIRELFQLVWGEVAIFRKSYFLICLILLFIGFWLGTQSQLNPYMNSFIFVPIPFVLGLLEVFKGRDQGLMEIELTCKVTAQQLMLTRLIIVLVGNMVFILLLMLVTSGGTGNLISWSALGLWYTQLIIAAGTSLWLAMRVRGGVAVSIFLIVWFGLVWLALSNPRLAFLFQQIRPSFLIMIALCGVLLLISQVYQMARKYTSQTERGYSFDIDHG
ncbi:hypothetical protein [Paenibacillus taichungensis]